MPPSPPDWITTQATVTTCRFQSSALSAMAFGVPLEQKFLITFDYYAHARLYSGHIGSPVAIPQDSQIPVAYNPLACESFMVLLAGQDGIKLTADGYNK